MISRDELALATRNHGMPLEALRYPVTPVGLHYLLVHYDIPWADAQTWRLRVEGLVERPLVLSLDDLREMPSVELISTMECAGNGRAHFDPRPVSQPWLDEAVGTGRWRGVPLAAVLDRAGPAPGAVDVVLTGLDRGIEGGIEQHYERGIPLEAALEGEALLAYELNGAPLPPQHGFPLRLVLPGWYGMTNVKWLARIALVAEPFAGYQQIGAYRVRESEDDPGTPLTRMRPRALMIPPGIPDFPLRRRTAPPGRHVLEGRAWSGWGPVKVVEVSVDGGASWDAATLERDVDSPWAWVRWSFLWEAAGGVHELVCRARDAAGDVQPLESRWNVGGYANNAAQRVRVAVAA